ncbi:tetratricopeptide repeat protein [Aliivibrio logei]|uniref:Sel1 repeat family protein n=1 Tax=Aliivibrio logei TaxID=688 RepID=A0A1B9P174_ALILO|nr:tetratricopeptide repeat protein [Aliivibrio logei]OCH22055.1 hypothetical protein A6E04_09390 [Aliivibrio logei]
MNIRASFTAASLVALSLFMFELNASDFDKQQRPKVESESQNQLATMALSEAYYGDSAAQIEIGHRYLTGDGVEKDEKKAARWFEIAALDGDPEAQTQLALLYASGTGVNQNYSQAIVWLGKAAKQDHDDALDLLHWMSQAAH